MRVKTMIPNRTAVARRRLFFEDFEINFLNSFIAIKVG